MPSFRWLLMACAIAFTCFMLPESAWAGEARDDTVASVPARLTISRIGLTADIVPVGIAVDGTMEVPQDPDAVGWYTLGPGIGHTGNMVLTGHVDWGGRLRVFGFLTQLSPGDTIVVTNQSGVDHRFTVQWKRLVSIEDPPMDEIFEQGMASEITLITCGGVFDRQRHEYLHRLVVRAGAESSAAPSLPSVGAGG